MSCADSTIAMPPQASIYLPRHTPRQNPARKRAPKAQGPSPFFKCPKGICPKPQSKAKKAFAKAPSPFAQSNCGAPPQTPPPRNFFALSNARKAFAQSPTMKYQKGFCQSPKPQKTKAFRAFVFWGLGLGPWARAPAQNGPCVQKHCCFCIQTLLLLHTNPTAFAYKPYCFCT